MTSIQAFRNVGPCMSMLAMVLCLGVSTATAAQTSFTCEVDGYEQSGKHLELLAQARDTYGEQFGIAYYGEKAVHARLREQASGLKIDPARTPIVNADVASGELDVFYCAAQTCTEREVAFDSLKACMSNLGAKLCRTYAIKVKDSLVCTLAPGLHGR